MFVRLAMDYDTEDLIEMGRLNCEQTCPGDVYSEQRAMDLIYAYHEEANPTFFVVEASGRKVIGFLMARMLQFDHRDGFYTTQSVLFVRPENRGSRAAVMLVKHLIEWSRQIGASAIIGGNDNGFRSERTAGFLEHFGFERVGFAHRKRL